MDACDGRLLVRLVMVVGAPCARLGFVGGKRLTPSTHVFRTSIRAEQKT